MTTLANLHRSVQSTIASKRLGTPVFVRYQLYSQDRGPAVTARLARLVGIVQGWLNQPLERIYAVGNVKSGQVTLTVECRRGATALVSWARSRAEGDGVDLMLIGNHGVLYHDGGLSELWDEPAEPLTDAPNKEMVNLVQRALRSGRPEAVKGGK